MNKTVIALLTALLVLALAVVSILRQQGDERNGTECVAPESFEVPTTKEHDPTLRPSPRSARVEASPRPTRKPSAVATHPQAVPTDAKGMLRSKTGQNSASAPRSFDVVRLAAEKSQLMDDLLNAEPIPSDYGQVMVGLFRDRSQDVYTRDFAVQHVGLYAEALQRRGSYDADSPEAASLRLALADGADETRTIVAAAAFRALDDLAAFDLHVDARHLESRLVACAADTSAAPAVRVMAVQLCGEREIASSVAMLRRIAGDQNENAVVRKSAARAVRAQEGR